MTEVRVTGGKWVNVVQCDGVLSNTVTVEWWRDTGKPHWTVEWPPGRPSTSTHTVCSTLPRNAGLRGLCVVRAFLGRAMLYKHNVGGGVGAGHDGGLLFPGAVCVELRSECPGRDLGLRHPQGDFGVLFLFFFFFKLLFLYC